MSDIFGVVLELAFPLLLLIALVSGVLIGILRWASGTAVGEYVPFVIAFSFLGGVPGAIAGASQEPIVGGMLTGLLGIVSALLAYLFSKDTLQRWRPVIPYAIITMVMCALCGLTLGGIRKAKFDNFDREFAVYRSELENLYFPVEKEARLIKLRKRYEDAPKRHAGVAKR